MKVKTTKKIAPPTRRGNCYVAAEALWHILGGRNGGWRVMRMRLPDGERHWFLRHEVIGILDPSRLQFDRPPKYYEAKHAAFLTQQPSKRAAALIETLTWQNAGSRKSPKGLRGRRA